MMMAADPWDRHFLVGLVGQGEVLQGQGSDSPYQRLGTGELLSHSRRAAAQTEDQIVQAQGINCRQIAAGK